MSEDWDNNLITTHLFLVYGDRPMANFKTIRAILAVVGVLTISACVEANPQIIAMPDTAPHTAVDAVSTQSKAY